MKTWLSVLTVLAVLIPAMSAQAQKADGKEPGLPSLNWGARIGFAATGTYITDAFIDGHKLTEYTQDTQVGNFAAVMLRINSQKMLVQSGIGLSFNKSSFFLDRNSWNPESESESEISCSYSLLSVTVPVQVGYHIVNRPPYCMSVFTGPRFRFTPKKSYSVQYNNLDPFDFTDSPTKLIVGWTAGLSVQTGRTFLDFEYEATINNISGQMHDVSGADPAPDYQLNRRVGIISFSYGIMF